jgi:serine/threonine protein kinase/WD40 repeat protein
MPDLVGHDIGRYHIVERLGEGGMATVYKAYDTRLERDVAIKFIRREAFSSEVIDRILKRFEREAKILARLSHPNIVKIHDYGEHDGSPYLVMEYIPSGALKVRTGTPMPWQEAVKLLIPVANALAYAHEENVIHRDIKPANILMTRQGHPMLSDFGVAKILDVDTGATLTGTNVGVGTPEYMAPEQWTNKVVPQTDIYALGIVLFELVTGKKPYTADTPAAVLLKQASDPLPRPKELVKDLPEGVEHVIFKALEKKPENRYASMVEFANALERLLASAATAPVHKVEVPQMDIMQDGLAGDVLKTSILISTPLRGELTHDTFKNSQENVKKIPIRAYLVASAFLGISILVVMILSGAFDKKENQTLTLEGTNTTIKETQPVEQPNATQLPVLPSPTRTSSPIPPTFSPTSTAISLPVGIGTPLPIPNATISANNIDKLVEIGRWAMEDIQIGAITFSPIGDVLYGGIWGPTGQLQSWRFEDGKVLQTQIDNYAPWKIALSPDGDLLADGTWKNDVQIWNTQTGSQKYQLWGFGDTPTCYAFSPDGNYIAAGSRDKSILIWSTKDGALVKKLTGHGNFVFDVLFSPDSKMLVSGSDDHTIRIWSIPDGKLIKTLNGHTDGVTAFVFSKDGKSFISSDLLGTLCRWSFPEGSLIQKSYNLYPRLDELAMSPDGSLLVLSNPEDTYVYFRSTSNFEEKLLLEKNKFFGGQLLGIAFSPNGKYLALSGKGGISIWGLPTK